MTELQTLTPKPTVYYDGACPLCRREIGVYRRRDAAGALAWVDVSVCAASDLPAQLTLKDAETRFHVSRADGTVLSGAAAFAEMWAVTPGFRWLGRIAKIAPVTALLERTYRGFLAIRPQMQGVARWLEARSNR